MLIPLHVHTSYSPCRGPSTPAAVAARAAALGYEAVAATDVNGLYGATVFHRAAVAAGVRPIVGAELRAGPASAVALVIDRGGYENLCRLLTRLHAGEEGGLAVLGDGLLDGLHLVTEDVALARAWRGAGVPPDRLWLAWDPPTQSRSLARRLQDAADELRLGLLATGRAMMATAADLPAARLLAAIRTGRTLDRLDGGEIPPPAAVLREPAAWRRALADVPEAIANNRRVAEDCRYAVLPRPPVFPAFDTPDGRSARDHLRRLCLEGALRRYGRLAEPVRRRLRREWGLIETKGFCEYFLVVRDIVQYAHRRKAPIAGRGSGASSLVAYVLGITNVCPLSLDIPFERFLNEKREDFPDLDIDFCWRMRDDVIAYAFDRWGAGNVAMVCTHNTFQPRSAFREAAKAMGLADAQVTAMMAGRGDAARIEAVARASEPLVGLAHLLSVHPGGIVIGRKPIDHYAPIETAAKGVRITQYDKDGVEDVGLVKLDLLGNRSLSTLREACDWVRRTGGADLDIDRLPADDAAAYALMRRGETVGCNQLESPAMRHLLQSVRPDSLRGVMQTLALVRPGAAGIGMKDTFIRRCRGLEPVPAGWGPVDAVLASTWGVMTYEDDVMLVVDALTGCGRAEADRFRKAVQKCFDDRQREDLSRDFLDRCAARGVDRRYAAGLWVQMAKFNDYSFCRAHAASYARLACAVAYLRAHHPLAFWTAALNNNQSMYHPRLYVRCARRGGVRFAGPDVNRSGAEFIIDEGVIRVGLGRVGGLGPVAVGTILDARGRGPFAGLADFRRRTRLAAEEIRSLILCGAFDAFGSTRPSLMMELKLLAGAGAPSRRSRAGGAGPALLTAAPALAGLLTDYSESRKRRDERMLLGLDLFDHPLAALEGLPAGAAVAGSADLPRQVGRRVRLAGMLEAARTTRTQGGRIVQFFTFDDLAGLFEATAFGDACRQEGAGGAERSAAVVTGIVEDQYGVVTLAAEHLRWIDPDGEGAYNQR
ncbi:MAG: DNA polymerase III subunit alpha [Planctomycetes bacterium]|nr:DNA polymerase III subunit alpha [Planctomycetota bacterium]